MREDTSSYSFLQASLLAEYQQLLAQKEQILFSLRSNHAGVEEQFIALASLNSKQQLLPMQLIIFDNTLAKLNTYIAISTLNQVIDDSLELKYITRLPSLFFRKALNKLLIIKHLKIHSLFKKEGLPREIGLLNTLISLDLNHCALHYLPAEIGLLKNLQVLELDDNKLAELPKEIGQLVNLKKLIASNNLMLTRLPTEIGNCEALEILDLHNDGLSQLPKEIEKLQHLRSLNVRHNHLKELTFEIRHMLALAQLLTEENDKPLLIIKTKTLH